MWGPRPPAPGGKEGSLPAWVLLKEVLGQGFLDIQESGRPSPGLNMEHKRLSNTSSPRGLEE